MKYWKGALAAVCILLCCLSPFALAEGETGGEATPPETVYQEPMSMEVPEPIPEPTPEPTPQPTPEPTLNPRRSRHLNPPLNPRRKLSSEPCRSSF